MPPHFRRHNAFTLLELLVVISIVSLLVAMLLPALAKARTAAQIAVCMGNQRQLGVIIMVYASDHQNFYPMPLGAELTSTTVGGIDGRARNYPWPALLTGYEKAPISSTGTYSAPNWGASGNRTYTGLVNTDLKNIYTCPDSRPGWWAMSAPSNHSVGGGTYTMNPIIFATWVGPTSTPENFYGANQTYFGTISIRTIDATRYPASTIATYDGYVNPAQGSSAPYLTQTLKANPFRFNTVSVANTETNQVPSRTHSRYRWHGNDDTNLAFLDGHVKTFNFGRQGVKATDDAAVREDLYRMTRGNARPLGSVTP